MAAARTRRQFTALDQEARVARAFREAGDYTFTPHDADTWVCDGPRGSFLTGAEACTCEDFIYVCEKVGARCKHQIQLGHRLLAAGEAFFSPGSGPERERPHTHYPFVCAHCHEPLRLSDMHIHEATGEVICKLCEPVPLEPPDDSDDSDDSDRYPNYDEEENDPDRWRQAPEPIEIDGLCPRAGEPTHLGWYGPACLRGQPPVDVAAPGPLSAAELASQVRLPVKNDGKIGDTGIYTY
jgi:hypothetical protein